MQLSTKNMLHDLIRYIPSIVFPSLLGFIAVAAYTRLLSPEEYGLYTLIFTTSLFIDIIFFNWLNRSILRYYERYKNLNIKEFYSTCLSAFFLVSAVIITLISLLTLIGGDLFDSRKKELLYYLVLVVFFQSGCKLMLIFQRAMKKSTRYSIHQSINAALKLLIGLFFIYFLKLKSEALLLGISIAGAYVFFYEFIRLAKKWQPRSRRFNISIFTTFTRYGFPLVGLALINLTLAASDRYIIEIFMGSTQVGIYSAGYKIAETSITGIVFFLSLAFFPSIFSTYENDGERETKLLMKDLLSIFIIVLVPAVAGITILARNIIAVMLGAEFQNSYVVLGWIAAGKFFGGLFPYYTKSFELKEKTIYLPFILLGPAILNIILNVLLIPYIGILGAAISTFVSYLACLILVSAFGSKFIKWIFPWSVLLKSVLASSFMLIVIQYLPDFNIHWITLLFIVFWGAVLYLFLISVFEKKVIKDGFHILKSRSA